MADILEKICAAKRTHIATLKDATPFSVMDKAARQAPAPRGFESALRRKGAAGHVALIAEIKKASPSAGVIRAPFAANDLARTYEEAGATCLSVLTDTPFFQGANDDLVAARKNCALPVLRKDFMLDVWQVAEARSIGADCILIIMAALDDSTAYDLHAAATDYGMDVLIESHDERELNRALKLPSGLIGINNRNLKTLDIDLATTEKLARLTPADRLLVSESGIRTRADITRLRAANAHCFLIGESLLKQPDLKGATYALLGTGTK